MAVGYIVVSILLINDDEKFLVEGKIIHPTMESAMKAMEELEQNGGDGNVYRVVAVDCPPHVL